MKTLFNLILISSSIFIPSVMTLGTNVDVVIFLQRGSIVFVAQIKGGIAVVTIGGLCVL